jgi:hypothetical protein
MSKRTTSRQARDGTVVGSGRGHAAGVSWPAVRGDARPAGAVLRWARLLAGASALAFVGASSAVVATPPALANHDSVKELCGRNYTVNRQHVGIRKNVTGRLLGRLVLVKNRRSRTYCAVVILRHRGLEPRREGPARLLLRRPASR